LEERLKERLTGAVLLVALVVVLVPAIFRGERPAAITTPVAQSQQVYTIDLNGAPPATPEESVASVPMAPAVAHAPEATPAAMPATPAAPATPVSPSPPPAAPAPAVAAPAPAVAASRPAAAPPAAPRQPAGAPQSTAKSSSAPHAPSGSGFVVQVGSFSSRENASQMVAQAARKGAHLMVAGPDDRGLFRVRSPVVRTRQEGVALQEKLRAQGYKGIVSAVN
jgi:DedD protein